MKLWQKDQNEKNLNKKIESFTVGNDYLLDKKLLYFDCIASIAHAKMLKKINILSNEELKLLIKGLNEIIDLNKKNEFDIKPEDEDCHTAIENYLVKNYGEVGLKIHTARSRNDQVLTALRLYEKYELVQIKNMLNDFKISLQEVIEKYGDINIVGYSHMQKAMPIKISTLIGSYIESNNDNIKILNDVMVLIDQSPLGSAAGFGVPILKIDMKLTSKFMNFSKVMENPLYPQLSRGKFESSILHVLTQIMFDLNKLSTDLIIFSMEEFGIISIPKDFCTGSSIMPQKKNPDVLELIRAKYHVIVAEEFKVKNIISNLMSGYNRDLQLTKEPLINSIELVKECLEVMTLVMKNIEVNEDKCKQTINGNKEIHATEEAYKLVSQGIPFRKAYKTIAEKYQN
ncbi:MAG: argininosuccinate lyase [Candidatus Woesearchaeota archaeon]